MPKISKIDMVPEEEFREIISSSNSLTECLKKIGLTGSSSYSRLNRRIEELGCSTEHFGNISSYATYSLDEILIENSTYANITRLKERLVREKRLEYKCSECGITNWMGKSLSLQLDHINGKHNDHRIENLRFLCPNCHSQTDTFAGRNVGNYD
jgi:Zn finger protein HypA/HybF involved in hydrogenase expression